jgi:hypothetical protein
MFGIGRIKPGEYVFAVKKDQSNYKTLIIGKVQSLDGNKLQVIGSFIRPVGLSQRVRAGRAAGRPAQVLENPDPNNCIFMLIDRVESGKFVGEIDQGISKTVWINEKRYFVLDGWIRENLPEMFANVLGASTGEERAEARFLLMEKMNSMYERDLKDHLYAVARSTRVL